MAELIVALAKDYPTALPLGLVALIGVAVWHVAISFANFRYMRQAMVTKKDLKIAFYEYQQELDKRFVTRADCAAMFNSRKNGEAHTRGGSL